MPFARAPGRFLICSDIIANKMLALGAVAAAIAASGPATYAAGVTAKWFQKLARMLARGRLDITGARLAILLI